MTPWYHTLSVRLNVEGFKDSIKRGEGEAASDLETSNLGTTSWRNLILADQAFSEWFGRKLERFLSNGLIW
jgi:hypothetical protein